MMKFLLLALFFFPYLNSAMAACTSTEKKRLQELNYSPLILNRICLRNDIKNFVLSRSSKAITLYRGIDVAPEKFDPRYNRFKDMIFTTQNPIEAFYYVGDAAHFSERYGTVIKYEVPEGYVFGLEADYSWLSVGKKFKNGKTLRSLPQGTQDLPLFVAEIGKFDRILYQKFLKKHGNLDPKVAPEKLPFITFTHSSLSCDEFLGKTLNQLAQ